MTRPRPTDERGAGVRVRQRTFRSSLKLFGLCAAPSVGLAAYVLWDGWERWNAPWNQPPYTPDPMLAVLCVLRALVAVAILVTVAALSHQNHGRSITVACDAIVARRRRAPELVFDCDETVGSFRRMGGGRWLSVIDLCDGEHDCRIEALFFPGFASLERVLQRALRRIPDTVTDLEDG